MDRNVKQLSRLLPRVVEGIGIRHILVRNRQLVVVVGFPVASPPDAFGVADCLGVPVGVLIHRLVEAFKIWPLLLRSDIGGVEIRYRIMGVTVGHGHALLFEISYFSFIRMLFVSLMSENPARGTNARMNEWVYLQQPV